MGHILQGTVITIVSYRKNRFIWGFSQNAYSEAH